MSPAPLWLLDEPRTGLDADAERRLDHVIRRHRDGDGMLVMALHGGERPEDARTLELTGTPKC